MNNQVMYAAGSSVIANDNSNQIISGVVVGHWESKKTGNCGYIIDAKDGRFMLSVDRVTLAGI